MDNTQINIICYLLRFQPIEAAVQSGCFGSSKLENTSFAPDKIEKNETRNKFLEIVDKFCNLAIHIKMFHCAIDIVFKVG